MEREREIEIDPEGPSIAKLYMFKIVQRPQDVKCSTILTDTVICFKQGWCNLQLTSRLHPGAALVFRGQ